MPVSFHQGSACSSIMWGMNNRPAGEPESGAGLLEETITFHI
jgi:hypothetical protein